MAMLMPGGRIIALLALVLVLAPGGALAHPAPDGFAPLAKRLSPAVVNIATSQKVEGDLPVFPKGSPLERFNDTFGPGGPRTENALGSGFVYDSKGIIVTNNHVVEGADEIEVIFPDGRTFNADLVGRDAPTDLAVLRIAAKAPLPHVGLGDSDTAEPGDWVLAIGNPFGLGGSLSVGIVSARNRDIQAGRYDDFIQTDAAINRGNSGGPLFNMDGEVIGVNSAILSPSGGSVGIGFAIPSNLVRSIVTQLLEHGEIRRGWIGVSAQSVSSELARSYGLDKAQGAIIVNVKPDGPAARAGLETGDLVTMFDGQPVIDSRTLTRAVADSQIGRKVTLEYVRDRKTAHAVVTIARLQETDKAQPAKKKSAASPTGKYILGMQLSPLSASLRRKYSIDSDVAGLVVLAIEPGSAAAGLVREGDVVEEMGWQKVTTLEAARARLAILAQHADRPVALLLNRDGQLIPRAIMP